MKWILAFILASVLILSGWSVSDLAAAPGEPMTAERAERMRDGIAKHEKELRAFYKLIDALEHVSYESNNAGRRQVINELQESMVRIILDLE